MSLHTLVALFLMQPKLASCIACTYYWLSFPNPPQFIPQSVSMFWIALTKLDGLSHQPVVSVPLPGPGSAVASGVQEQTSPSQ